MIERLRRCGLEPWPGHNKDFKNGTYSLLVKCSALKELRREVEHTATSGLTPYCSYHCIWQMCDLGLLKQRYRHRSSAIQHGTDFIYTVLIYNFLLIYFTKNAHISSIFLCFFHLTSASFKLHTMLSSCSPLYLQ